MKVYLEPTAGLLEYRGEHDCGAIYDIDDALWEEYRGHMNAAADIEDRIMADDNAVDIPDDLAALVEKGVLTGPEVAAILEQRSAVVKVTSEPLLSDEDLLPPVPAGVPACPVHRGGIHVPARHFLQEDNTVDAQCACGRLMKGVPCPHKTQKLRGSTVVCDWCSQPLIKNASVIDPGPVQRGYAAPEPNPRHYMA